MKAATKMTDAGHYSRHRDGHFIAVFSASSPRPTETFQATGHPADGLSTRLRLQGRDAGNTGFVRFSRLARMSGMAPSTSRYVHGMVTGVTTWLHGNRLCVSLGAWWSVSPKFIIWIKACAPVRPFLSRTKGVGVHSTGHRVEEKWGQRVSERSPHSGLCGP